MGKMTSLLIELIQDWCGSIGVTLNEFFSNLYYFVFFIEEQFKDITSNGNNKYFIDFTSIYKTVYAWGMVFLIIIFIKKMIQTYFLFKTGEEDQSPLRLVIGLIEAVIIDITFGWIYVFVVKIGYSFYQDITNSAGFNFDANFMSSLKTSAGFGLFSAVCVLIITCEFLGLIWNMIKRGLQILVLRIVIPITTIGLLDSNGGSFAVVVKKLLQNIFTVIVQLIFMQFSFLLISKQRYIYAIASMLMTIDGPEFLRDFLVGVGGLGVSQMINSGANFAHHALSIPGQVAHGIGSTTGTVHNGISGFTNGVRAMKTQAPQITKSFSETKKAFAEGNIKQGFSNLGKTIGHVAGTAGAIPVGMGYTYGRQFFTNENNGKVRQNATGFMQKYGNFGIPNSDSLNRQSNQGENVNSNTLPPANNIDSGGYDNNIAQMTNVSNFQSNINNESGIGQTPTSINPSNMPNVNNNNDRKE